MGDPSFFREAEYMSSIPVSHLTYLVTEVVDKSSIKSAFKSVSVSVLVILLLTPVTIKVSKETGDKKAIPTVCSVSCKQQIHSLSLIHI